MAWVGRVGDSSLAGEGAAQQSVRDHIREQQERDQAEVRTSPNSALL